MVCAHLENGAADILPHKLLDGLGSSSDAYLEAVALSVAGLELLGGAQAAERSVDHDAHPRAQSLTLHHAGHVCVGVDTSNTPVCSDCHTQYTTGILSKPHSVYYWYTE